MKILLHICCGVCAGSVGETLLNEGHNITGFYYNPNIHPREEYERRLESVKQISAWLKIPLVVPVYEPGPWLQATQSVSQELEGGSRCTECFRLRLRQTYIYMVDKDFEAFTTTLTVSPHKSADTVNRIGREIGGQRFITRDFKKKDGFKRSNDIARELALYHQQYCGCIYSLQASKK